jgi:hypothetical protein
VRAFATELVDRFQGRRVPPITGGLVLLSVLMLIYASVR